MGGKAPRARPAGGPTHDTWPTRAGLHAHGLQVQLTGIVHVRGGARAVHVHGNSFLHVSCGPGGFPGRFAQSKVGFLCISHGPLAVYTCLGLVFGFHAFEHSGHNFKGVLKFFYILD